MSLASFSTFLHCYLKEAHPSHTLGVQVLNVGFSTDRCGRYVSNKIENTVKV